MSETRYSPTIPGTTGNHRRAARFDWTDGHIGITAMPHTGDDPIDRVLLTPGQWAALLAFVQKQKARP
jgi:hypothetical protein